MNEKGTKELVESLSDYKFTITECAKSLEEYMLIVKEQEEEIKELKEKINKLESEK